MEYRAEEREQESTRKRQREREREREPEQKEQRKGNSVTFTSAASDALASGIRRWRRRRRRMMRRKRRCGWAEKERKDAYIHRDTKRGADVHFYVR